MIVNRHLAQYGKITMLRGYCTDCKAFALIIDGEIQCCGEPDKKAAILKRSRLKRSRLKRKRMCTALGSGRSRRYIMRRILEEQANRCFYCLRRFGVKVWRKRKSFILRHQWEHIICYGFSGDNREENIVAACQICNGIKSSFIFDSIEEARLPINEAWKRKGYSDLRPMFGEVHTETSDSGVLHGKLPEEGMA
jgi:hypothetical protein